MSGQNSTELYHGVKPMSDNSYDSQSENPYASPSSVPEYAQPEPTEHAEELYLRAFVGSNADYYLRKWFPLRQHAGNDGGFNWAAFLLSVMWIAYRKMYRVAAILVAILLLETVAEEILFVVILGGEVPPGTDTVIGLVVAIICGANGNRWYLSHAKKEIAKVADRGFDQQEVIHALTQRGGASLAASLGCILLFVVCSFAVFVALDFILFPA